VSYRKQLRWTKDSMSSIPYTVAFAIKSAIEMELNSNTSQIPWHSSSQTPRNLTVMHFHTVCKLKIYKRYGCLGVGNSNILSFCLFKITFKLMEEMTNKFYISTSAYPL